MSLTLLYKEILFYKARKPLLLVPFALKFEISFISLLMKSVMVPAIGADYVEAWGLEPPLDNAMGGSVPLKNHRDPRTELTSCPHFKMRHSHHMQMVQIT